MTTAPNKNGKGQRETQWQQSTKQGWVNHCDFDIGHEYQTYHKLAYITAVVELFDA